MTWNYPTQISTQPITQRQAYVSQAADTSVISTIRYNEHFLDIMVARGLAGAAALALALASAGAFAPGSAFVRNPLNPASHGINRVVNKDGSVATSTNVSFLFLIL